MMQFMQRGEESLHQLVGWVLSIPRNRAWAPWLIAANLVGAIYGIYWYWPQLVTTPWWFWPLVPDSPLSNLLFALFLVGWYYRRAPGWLSALAVVGMIKYGGWTVLIFTQMYVAGYSLSPLDLWLMLSHLAMMVEALLFLGHVRLAPQAWAVATGWYLINDFFDYVVGLHPTLPVPAFVSSVAMMSVVLTVVGSLLLWQTGVRGCKRYGVQTSCQC